MQIPVLVGIMSTLLASDKLVTAEELANRFEISKRSVYRYIAMLSEGGVPIESHLGRGGGWGIVDTYKLNATFFTEEEYRRLIFALQSFSLQDEVTKMSVQKLSGLKRSHTGATVLKSEQLVVDMSDLSVGDYVSVLSDCVSKKMLCEIEYHSKAGAGTLRIVEPYCLILKDGSWYVYCFCRLRKGFRYFKISRIVKLSVGERFIPRSFEVDSSVIGTDVLRGKEICEVILSLEHKALTACEEWLGIGRVAQVGEGYVAKAALPFDDVLINQILALGDGVRVEKPARLREAVVERCKIVAEMNRKE
ncbi:MAG: YafY family transcriptional regulator [Corallococcus sp.]|nr:YafY family transcriptional regulator [Corallococcus sp.]MCM1359223.1 YafY family transcriptional regulator [Corallococcus sp.]MCM1394613.1 YafY family transcriptional regulator [Corallococcus sp.]